MLPACNLLDSEAWNKFSVNLPSLCLISIVSRSWIYYRWYSMWMWTLWWLTLHRWFFVRILCNWSRWYVKSRVNSMILLPTLPSTRYLYILVWFLHCKALHSISRILIHPFPSLSGVIAHFLAVVVVSPLLLTYHGPMWVLYAVYSLCIYVRSIGWSLVVVPCRLSAMLACRESGIMVYLRVSQYECISP